jgi:hypothetical protein
MSKFSCLIFNAKTNQFFRTIPLASFYDARQGTTKMDYNQGKKIMITVSTDRTIKVRFHLNEYFCS